ncbi:MAG: acyltransferase [Leuconostoc mesenteroides]|uniref:acyltransferase n=1 Tax=Leuconostoc mesenteroides TaxID=1245 RepID=UPI002361A3BE|nr:acyltransferase [Leuconostoc mesenteroides]MCH3952775.1 acyltransferase [Leuconostoc mesenteroides]MCH3978940.1 acyltransferase [Leuconostoc mesenteroides]MCI2089412.1 acyltransferase [Leuconostoc mesenteroides]MCI2121052.1 acyltransferase [Leuconostoc mesenteroides]
MQSEKKHHMWVDYCRLIAIIFVIINHSNEQINLNPISKSSVLLEFIGRMGVPIFLILTGYLMINREYDKNNAVHKFVKNNLLNICYSAIFWTIVFSLYTFFFLQSTTDGLIKDLIFQQRPLPQMWYIQILPIIYAFIPLLSLAKKKLPSYLLGTFVVGVIMLSSGNYISTFTENKYIPFQWNFNGSWSLVFIMISLMFFGSYLDKFASKKIFITFIVGNSLILLCLGGLLLMYLPLQNIFSSFWYDQPLIFISGATITVFLFVFLKRFTNESHNNLPLEKLISLLAKLSYGVYALHYVILLLVIKLINPAHGIKNSLILAAIVVILSFAVTYIASKIPKLPKFILLIKK